MGVYDRDYYRNDPPGGRLMGGAGSACKWLIAINIVVYMLQLVTDDSGIGRSGVTEWLVLSADRVIAHGEVWRLVTSAFCHAPDNLWHIILNMVLLWICGSQVESIYGEREFLKFYLTAALISSVGFLGIELILNKFVLFRIPHELGASGAVMGVMMLCALYYPTMKIVIMFVLPVELRWLVAMYVVYDMYPLLREIGGVKAMDQVAHATHLSGLLYGYLYKRFDLRYSRLLAGWSWFKVKRMVRTATTGRPENVRLYNPPQEELPISDLKVRVDEILAKISAQGESSLTDSERELLKQASRLYKKK